MFRFFIRRQVALGALLVFGGLTPAHAADTPLTLREALSRTLQSNPDLAAYQYVLKAQDGRITQVGLRPNPRLNADLENVLGSGGTKGFDAAELTIGLSQLIELGGLRDKRVATASIEREGLEIEGQIARLDSLAETTRRFVSLVSQQEEHRLTHLAVELAEKTDAAVKRRVQAAKSPEAEKDRADVALERARISDAHADDLTGSFHSKLIEAKYQPQGVKDAEKSIYARANRGGVETDRSRYRTGQIDAHGLS